MDPVSDPAAVFERARPRLFGMAYRMLGSVADAEDLVQETYLRWHEADRKVVRISRVTEARYRARRADDEGQPMSVDLRGDRRPWRRYARTLGVESRSTHAATSPELTPPLPPERKLTRTGPRICPSAKAEVMAAMRAFAPAP